MHEAEGRAQDIAYIYRLLDADRMGATAPISPLFWPTRNISASMV